jgi:methyl-accepting chemotaxis protein
MQTKNNNYIQTRLMLAITGLCWLCIVIVGFSMYYFLDAYIADAVLIHTLAIKVIGICSFMGLCTACFGYAFGSRFIKILKIDDINQKSEAFLTDFNHAIIALSHGHVDKLLDTHKYQGQFADTATAFNDSLQEIAKTIYAVKHIGTVLSDAGYVISNQSTNLAMRAEQQATSLQEITATMEEMTATIQLNADNCSQARTLSSVSVTKATEGYAIASGAVASMSHLEKTTKRIQDIVKLIDEIALQTNLLALNAAVEAARAGDAGKGFSVVASEVRVLAQRSRTAANDISNIIMQSNDTVDACVACVTKTGESFKNIMDSTYAVETMISHIATASKEQSTAVSEISKTLVHIDETTQTTAQIAEECATSSQDIKKYISELSKAIRFFKVSDSDNQTIQNILELLKQSQDASVKKVLRCVDTSHYSKNNDDVYQKMQQHTQKNWKNF